MRPLHELKALALDALPDDAFHTYSGRLAYVNRPWDSHIDLDDIAATLARVVRFGGMLSVSYTVAQHSVLVSRLVSPENRLIALLHDATEAYLGDVISPLKRQIPEYRNIESAWAREIGWRFGLREGELVRLPDEVKQADLTMYLSERARFKPGGEVPGFEPVEIDCVWSAEWAAWKFKQEVRNACR
jgi:hypothetical protein